VRSRIRVDHRVIRIKGNYSISRVLLGNVDIVDNDSKTVSIMIQKELVTVLHFPTENL